MLTVLHDKRIVVSGEQVIDIRKFEIAAPTMLMLKIYPDVRVFLHLEAEASLSARSGNSGATQEEAIVRMGIVLAFAVGYAVGANAGQEGYQEVVDTRALPSVARRNCTPSPPPCGRTPEPRCASSAWSSRESRTNRSIRVDSSTGCVT